MGNYECGVIMRIDGTSEADLEKKANALITYQRPLEPVRIFRRQPRMP